MRKEVVTMKVGLILVDIQNDYFRDGKYELVNPEQAVIQANKIISFLENKIGQYIICAT